MPEMIVYVYRFPVDRGMEYAVSEFGEAGEFAIDLAKFRRGEDAVAFAYGMQERRGATVHILPSAESAFTKWESER